MMYSPRDAATATSMERYGECLHLQFELIARMLKPGMTVLEVGAGIGIHSVPIAAVLGEKGHLFLYEDDAVLKHVLHENLRGNRISNATVMRRSLARSATTDVSDVRSEHSTWGIPQSEAAESQTETIDELRLQRIDLLKINECADPTLVVRGATATLRRLRPRLFIAVSNEQALEDVAAVITPVRYACWKAAVPMFNPANFNGRDVDVFEGRKSLALVAVAAESAGEVDKSGVSFLSSATDSVLVAMPRSDG
jgi:FkbM family methyltransferase